MASRKKLRRTRVWTFGELVGDCKLELRIMRAKEDEMMARMHTLGCELRATEGTDCSCEVEILLHIGDVVRFKATGMVAKVARFTHDGSTDFWADNETGPYKQADVERLRAG